MKKILIVSVLILTFVLCGCKTQVDAPIIPSVDTQEVEESDIVIEDNIFSEETEFDAGISAEIYITAPKAVAPMYGENVDKFNQLIEMNTDTIKNEYFHDVAIGEASEGVAATSRMMTYDVYTAKDGYISVMLKITASIAGFVNPTVVYRCINYDLNEGKLLSLTDVVGDDKVDSVKSLILDQMKKAPDKYFSVEDNVLADVDIDYSFLEKDGKIFIVINEYTIAPRSAGAQIFEINKGDIV